MEVAMRGFASLVALQGRIDRVVGEMERVCTDALVEELGELQEAFALQGGYEMGSACGADAFGDGLSGGAAG